MHDEPFLSAKSLQNFFDVADNPNYNLISLQYFVFIMLFQGHFNLSLKSYFLKEFTLNLVAIHLPKHNAI